MVRSSYIHNGISYTGKMTYLYWIGIQVVSTYILQGYFSEWKKSQDCPSENKIYVKHVGKCIHPRYGTIDSKYKSQYSRVHIWWDMLYMVYVININTLY